MMTKLPCSLVLHPNLLKISTLFGRQREKTAQILTLQLPFKANPHKVKKCQDMVYMSDAYFYIAF